jgi:hypothetical protein
MMTAIRFGGWVAGSYLRPNSQLSLRAEIQQSHILDKPTDVELLREGVPLPPQTVRIEPDNSSQDANSDLGDSRLRKVQIFGIQGHPELDDTDIEMWDTFRYKDAEYTVLNINREGIGLVIAYCEAVG